MKNMVLIVIGGFSLNVYYEEHLYSYEEYGLSPSRSGVFEFIMADLLSQVLHPLELSWLSTRLVNLMLIKIVQLILMSGVI